MPIDLAAAAARQSQILRQIPSGVGFIPLEHGVLAHSGGDGDATLLRLLQQGYALRRKNLGLSENPLVVAALSRGGSEEALNYTAGVHKRGLPIHQVEAPFRTTAFPPERRLELAGHFDLHTCTPTGDWMESGFPPEVLKAMPEESFILFDTKTFDPKTGQEIDELSEKSRQAARRMDIATGFTAGFTGAKAVFARRLPAIKGEEGVHGVMLGIGTTSLKKGCEVAALMTGVSPDQAQVMEVGGAQVHVFRNYKFPIPMHVSVYEDPQLRRAQLLYAIYKNAFSVINGRDLFHWVLQHLAESKGIISTQLVDEATDYYRQLMIQSQEELRIILRDVEVIPADKINILPSSEVDAEASWGMKDMDRFCRLVQNLFFGEAGPDGVIVGNHLEPRIAAWKKGIREVFDTRNPAAGAALAASIVALQFNLVGDPLSLLPEDMTFEGINTAVYLDRRLSPEQMARLPRRVQVVIEELKPIRHPQVIPSTVRRDLTLIASALAKRATGARPTVEEMEALLFRKPSMEEMEKMTFQWRSTINTQDLLVAVDAIRRHLQVVRVLVEKYGEAAVLSESPVVSSLNVVIERLVLLDEVIRQREILSPLTSTEVQKLIHALKVLVVEGERIYLDESLATVLHDLDARFRLMVAYLCQMKNVTDPYPKVSVRQTPGQMKIAHAHRELKLGNLGRV